MVSSMDEDIPMHAYIRKVSPCFDTTVYKATKATAIRYKKASIVVTVEVNVLK